jgi:hypothetical protein
LLLHRNQLLFGGIAAHFGTFAVGLSQYVWHARLRPALLRCIALGIGIRAAGTLAPIAADQENSS